MASLTELIMKYVQTDASFPVLILDAEGHILNTNRYTRELVGENLQQQTLNDIIVDFTGTVKLSYLLDEPGRVHLLNVRTAGGLPQTFYFRFFHAGTKILAIGEINSLEFETLRKELITANNELSNLGRELQKKSAEQKRTEEKLQNQVETVTKLLANLPAGVIIINPETRMIENVNDVAATMFGARKESIVGHICHAFLCPASQGTCPVCDLGKEVDNAEREMLCADGNRRPVLKTVKRIQILGQEKLLECFIDITERKQAEKALKESEERYRIAIEASNDGVAIVQNDTHVYVNKAYLAMFGYSSLDEIVGKQQYCTVHPDDYGRVIGYARARKKGEHAPARYEFKGIRKDGTPIDIEISANTILYNGEKAILAYLRDTTEHKRLEEERRHREKLEGVLEMAGTICHELNQPIQIISGYVDLLSMDALDDSQTGKKLDEMKGQINRMGIVTKKLMSLKNYTTRDYIGIGKIIDITTKEEAE